MGIDKFHTWLKQKYSVSMSDYNGKSFDHLYIDLNFMLHRLVLYTPTYDELIERIIQTIKDSMRLNKPRRSITLVADGSASYAKIMAQKESRLRTVQSMIAKIDQANSMDNVFEEENVIIVKKDIKDVIRRVNPLILTPGTEFMNKFGRKIKEFAKHLNIDVHISLADEPDESELKICRFIQENASINETHLIQSNDADIILIGLALKNVNGVNVMIQHNRVEESYIISIDKLVDLLERNVGYHRNKRLDFVFLSMMMGNDYYPKLKRAEFDRLWDIYSRTISPNETIVQDNFEIDYDNFKDFLAVMIQETPNRYQHVDIDEMIHSHVEEYLYGLVWCTKLYATGKFMNYNYLYFGSSIHPLCIHVFLSSHPQFKINMQMNGYTPIPSLIYPVIVMPYNAIELIPGKYHQTIRDKLMFMYDEEMCDECAKYRKYVGVATQHVPDEFKMAKYIQHRKTHSVKNPKEYIDKIVEIINDIDS